MFPHALTRLGSDLELVMAALDHIGSPKWIFTNQDTPTESPVFLASGSRLDRKDIQPSFGAVRRAHLQRKNEASLRWMDLRHGMFGGVTFSHYWGLTSPIMPPNILSYGKHYTTFWTIVINWPGQRYLLLRLSTNT
jgi:hypothetical protein